MTPTRPDLRHERSLLRGGARVVVGMDEVGRGALAGPVSVGAVAVDLTTRACPRGVADSKLLTAAARERLRPALQRWGVGRAVGHASPAEIDAVGIVAALRLAGMRALALLDLEVDLVLLDGSHDWLTPPAQGELFGSAGGPLAPGGAPPVSGPGPFEIPASSPGALGGVPVVRTKVRADRSCASVAAASVLAKCERDALMIALADDHPAYGWQENKGYGAPGHLEALRLLGPSTVHRRSWRLPGTGETSVLVPGRDAAAGSDVAPGWAMMDR